MCFSIQRFTFITKSVLSPDSHNPCARACTSQRQPQEECIGWIQYISSIYSCGAPLLGLHVLRECVHSQEIFRNAEAEKQTCSLYTISTTV